MVVFYCVVSLIYFQLGGFVEDEGFYTLAARCVMQGMKLYRDFMFPQMPVMPYVYAAWFSLAGASIQSGRTLSMLLGASSVAMIAWSSYRRGGRIAGIVGGSLVAFNLHFIGDTIAIKTQVLTVFLTSCAIFVLSRKDSPRPLLRAGLAMLFMTLAFLERLSILPALLLLWIYLAWELRQFIIPYLGLFVLNLLAIAGTYAYFYSDGNMFFGIYQSHQELYPGDRWTWERLGITIHSFLGNQFPIILLSVCGIWTYTAGILKLKKLTELTPDLLFAGYLILSYMGATFIHWKNISNYATHQTSITAFAAVFAAVVLAPTIENLLEMNPGFWRFAFGALLLLPLPLGEIGMQLGVNAHADLSGPAKIREAESIIRKFASPGDSILSFDLELAVDGGYKVPSGYEQSEFSYFPFMDSARASKLHLVNFQKLSSDLNSGNYKVFCTDDRHFQIMAAGNQDMAKALKEALDTNYQLGAVVKGYGQFGLPLYIFVAKHPNIPTGS